MVGIINHQHFNHYCYHCLHGYNPVGGGRSFLPLLAYIDKKKCTINVENRNDHLCLVWSILVIDIQRRDGWSHTNPHRLTHHQRYFKDVNMNGVQISTPASSISC